MTQTQALATIAIIGLCTLLTRAMPFLIFPNGKRIPDTVAYLGKALPCAIIGMLCVYCIKDVPFFVYPYGLPELISISAIIGLHLYKRNVLLSIGAGTVLYIVLSQAVFA